jgi:hypothetical protein
MSYLFRGILPPCPKYPPSASVHRRGPKGESRLGAEISFFSSESRKEKISSVRPKWKRNLFFSCQDGRKTSQEGFSPLIGGGQSETPKDFFFCKIFYYNGLRKIAGFDYFPIARHSICLV